MEVSPDSGEALDVAGKDEKETLIEPHHVEDALHTMLKAEEHKRNPKMMGKVKALAAQKKMDLGKIGSLDEAPSLPRSVADLKKLRNTSKA